MIDYLDEQIIRKLQQDIPINKEPYKQIAQEIGIDENQLLSRIENLHNTGVLKRVGAVICHKEADFKSNALVVWKVPSEAVEVIGAVMASVDEISHCYERVTCENWKYNMFTMIHGKTKKQCEKIIKQVSDSIRIYDYRALYTMRELKKVSMKY